MPLRGGRQLRRIEVGAVGEAELDRHRRVALDAERAERAAGLALAALVHRDEHRIVGRVGVHRARPLLEVLGVALACRSAGSCSSAIERAAPSSLHAPPTRRPGRGLRPRPRSRRPGADHGLTPGAGAPAATHWISAQRSGVAERIAGRHLVVGARRVGAHDHLAAPRIARHDAARRAARSTRAARPRTTCRPGGRPPSGMTTASEPHVSCSVMV